MKLPLRLGLIAGLSSGFAGYSLCTIARADEFGERAKNLLKHIEYLASDELEGRGVGSKGIEAAAEYIAAEFKKAGLEPGGSDGTYFQSFPIALDRKLVDGNKLAFSGESKSLEQEKDFIPLSFSWGGEFSGKAVFCGYAIINPEKAFDDFKQVDLQGKVALVLDGEPATWADADGNPTRHALRRNKVYNVKDRGAVAILLISQRPAAGGRDVLTPFRSEGADDYGIPALHLSRQAAADVLKRAGAGDLDELQSRLEKGQSASTELAKTEAQGEVNFEKKTATTRNVLGALKGSGPLADEWIVIGAHYDHLGLRVPSMRTFKDGKIVEGSSKPEIHNGADDNASGIAGLIEIAKGLAGQPKCNRSVLYIAFSAEETGLQGSKYYADNAPEPLEKTVAMLNMDMIGRLPSGETKVTVFGANSAAEFMPVLEAAGAGAGLKIHPGVDSGGRSDHAVFVRKGIPSLHFYSGNHPEYHKPSDDTHLINSEGAARIAVVVEETARALANATTRPKLLQEPREAKAADPHAAIGAADADKLPSYRVVMGLSPSYTDDGQAGMGVDAVSPEGPAERAGIKAGDRIIRVNGKAVTNIYDYMASTRDNKPGDPVDVILLRGKREIQVKVVLAGAR